MAFMGFCWTLIQGLFTIFIVWFIIGTSLLLVEALCEYTDSGESQRKDNLGTDEKTRLQVELQMLDTMANERRKRLAAVKRDG